MNYNNKKLVLHNDDKIITEIILRTLRFFVLGVQSSLKLNTKLIIMNFDDLGKQEKNDSFVQ